LPTPCPNLVHFIAGLVVLSSTILTWYGKLGGETYAFLMGTIIGYIISLLSG
jgi:xanthine/uracil permease